MRTLFKDEFVFVAGGDCGGDGGDGCGDSSSSGEGSTGTSADNGESTTAGIACAGVAGLAGIAAFSSCMAATLGANPPACGIFAGVVSNIAFQACEGNLGNTGSIGGDDSVACAGDTGP